MPYLPLLAILLLALHPRAAAQTVRIAPTQAATPVSPLLYGQFIEHLGRCIDGGLYAEDSR